MKFLISEYVDYLQFKRDIIEEIHENTVRQSHALKKKDEKLLGRLLAERQELIDVIKEISQGSEVFKGIEKDREMIELEQSIQGILQVINLINEANMVEAVRQKNEMGNIIRNIKNGKKSIRFGYYKSAATAYGCFFDKKVGSKVKTK